MQAHGRCPTAFWIFVCNADDAVAEEIVSGKLIQKIKSGSLKKLRIQQFFCICAAILLSVSWSVMQRSESDVTESGLLREGYGGHEQNYQLEVEGLEDAEKKTLVTIPVSPRKYSKEEAETAFYELAEELPSEILGDNENLANVVSDLKLPGNVPERGIRITWYPEDPDLLSFEGTVENKNLTEPQKTRLRAVMTDGVYSGTFVYDLTVKPRILEGRDALLAAFLNQISDADQQQAEQAELMLPAEFSGRKLRYRKQVGYEGVLLLLLGVLASLLLGLRAHTEEQEMKKKRREELLLDYSEFVSKFIVYLGAGLTLRNAWQKIVGHYLEARKTGSMQKRCVYEEMLTTLRDMEKGIPESGAYQAFGRRCGLQPYIKFCTLLEQNRKNGGRNLKTQLTAEMDTAFEERKNSARRRGEEAGTKLLLPLFMMLIIVMAVVVLPAMLSMG